MEKFKCKVAVVSEYIIEINDDNLGQEFLDNFKKYFADFDFWEQHAVYIAERKALGDDFIEGYGTSLVNGKKPMFCDEKSLNLDINVNVIYENVVDVECVDV